MSGTKQTCATVKLGAPVVKRALRRSSAASGRQDRAHPLVADAEALRRGLSMQALDSGPGEGCQKR